MLRVLRLRSAAIGQFIRFCVWNGHDQEDAPNWASNHAQLIIKFQELYHLLPSCSRSKMDFYVHGVCKHVYIRWVQRLLSPAKGRFSGKEVNPRCILSCFIFVKFLPSPWITFSTSLMFILYCYILNRYQFERSCGVTYYR